MVAKASFPPCTAPDCAVDESEKQEYADKAASKPSCEMQEKCVNACAAYGKVCPCAARIAAHAACEAMQDLMDHSHFFPQEKPDFPFLDADDVVIGEKLGEGGFSNVNQCVVTSGDEAGQEFAVKYLKRKAMVDLHHFKHGAADIAVEAFFLFHLNHPHIVKLHGVTAGSIETNVATGKECGFFIVVDRLGETLEQRIEKWRKERENSTKERFMARMSSEHREKKRTELMERIRMAYSIADAMEYLHSSNIIFRDLKPDNIGFDKDGVLKLFDFGLAKELKPEDVKTDGRYELTGNTGSRRYMAPEVAKECPYDKSVDAYSFGIMLWELCSAEKPFYGYSSNKHMHKVVMGGERPKMDSHHTADWPMNLQWLMSRCWSAFPSARPSFADIKQILKDILHEKDEIPVRLASLAAEEQANNPAVQLDKPKPGFFGALFRPSRQRAKTDGKKSSTGESHTFGNLQPLKPSGRHRSLGSKR